MANRSRKSSAGIVNIIITLLLAAVLVFIVKARTTGGEETKKITDVVKTPAVQQTVKPETPDTETPDSEEPSGTEVPAEPEKQDEPDVFRISDFHPHAVEGTEPGTMITSTEVMVNGEEVEKYESSYDEISFEVGELYTELQGIIGFRGNNFRDTASYGTTTALTEKKFDTAKSWNITTGILTDYNGNNWSGSGWTGQPMVVRWPKETRQIMTSMKEWAREQDDLVEVIYPTMDGNIYFLELQTGKATRNKLKMGLTYKGCGALDPRGYPILYVGSGVRNMDGQSHVSVIDLINCKVMYTFGDKDKFALRDWPMYDSSPLVDAETDQLIYPGENGILYLIHLNTKYDPEAGTISIDPDNVVKWRYHSERQTRYIYWLGMESSAAALGGYLFMCDNGGNLMCLDLNTLELVWRQEIVDDSNCSPVIDIENGHPYIYVSCSYHYGWRGTKPMDVPIFKIDAETGEIVWRRDYECYTDSGVSGGVQGTMAVDDEYVYVPVAKCGSANGGLLVALDKDTGEEVWNFSTTIYSWGSPILFKDETGESYLIYNTGYSSNGYLYLLDPKTGKVHNSLNLAGNIEPSGVVFDNWLVIGHRSCRIIGIPLK